MSAALAEAASGKRPSQAGAVIVDADWQKLQEYLSSYDAKREDVIKQCRDIQKNAKQAIYSLHRGDGARAEQQLATCRRVAEALLPTIKEHPPLRQGSYSFAMEEYAEAVALQVYLSEGRLVTSAEVPLAEPEEFLGGILDFTGELNRYAVMRATCRDVAGVQACRDLVDGLMGKFLQFDLRNSFLRKKYDVLKYTLRKLENTLYELSLAGTAGTNPALAAGALGRTAAAGGGEPGAEPSAAAAAEGGGDEAAYV